MNRLLIISSAPATIVDGELFLDIKFIEGMRVYQTLWNGPVSCILKLRSSTFPFGKIYEPSTLPFNVNLIPAHKKIDEAQVNNSDIVLCDGDSHEYLHLAALCQKAGITLAYTIEYITETRRQIILLDRSRSLSKKLYSLAWMINQERRRRKAFRLANGIQANGFPAYDAYNSMNKNTIMYIDNRVGKHLLATQTEMEERHKHLVSNLPLRLIHSGRLEPMKGAQDLIPIALKLVSLGINFELSIFGSGSLEEEIKKSISKHNLTHLVKLNGAVDFESELVPFARTQSDIYLSCHRQSDPSCTYIESMGCGLAIIGYNNRMWSALNQASEAGWAAPLGNINAISDLIAAAAKDRENVAKRCYSAWSFARSHTFEHEFKSRINHLKKLAQAS